MVLRSVVLLFFLATPLWAQTTVEAALAQAKAAIRMQDYIGALAVLDQPDLAQSPQVLLMQASLYQAGRGVPRDDAKAFALTQAAAALGNVDAQYNLGRLLLSGRGVEANRVAGQAWITQAAESGHIRAAALLVNLLQTPVSTQAAQPAVAVALAPVQGSEISRRMGWTPLMEAARRGQHKLLESLLEAENLEAKDTIGRTALMLAVEAQDAVSVGLLIRAGADVAAVDKAGNTALGYGARGNDSLIVRMLLARNAWPDIPNGEGQTPLERAIIAGNGDVAVLMLGKRGLTLPDELVRQLWFLAAQHGSLDVFEALQQRGAACGLQDNEGLIALDHAAENGNVAMVHFCLPDAAAGEGIAPLVRAVRAGHMAVAQALLDADQNPNTQSESGNSPLIMAAYSGNVALLQALIEADADLDHRNQSGNSALMLAAQNGRAEVVNLLLLAGADTGLRNKQREQAHDIARAAGHPELAAMLE
jgi:ankyrin repeat protein